MEPLDSGLLPDSSRVPAPEPIRAALQQLEDRQARESGLDEGTPLRIVDGDIEIDLEYSPRSRFRFVVDEDGQAHVQYWTWHHARQCHELEADWPVNLDDPHTTARTAWYLIAQVHCAIDLKR